MNVNKITGTREISNNATVTPLQKAIEAFKQSEYWYRDLGNKAAAVHPGELGTQAQTAAQKLEAFSAAAKSLSAADKVRLQAHMNNGKTVETYVAGCANGIKITLMGRLDRETANMRAKNFSGKNRQFVEANMAATDSWYFNFAKGISSATSTLGRISGLAGIADLSTKAGSFSAAIREKYSAALESTHSNSESIAARIHYNGRFSVADSFVSPERHNIQKRFMYEEAWRVAVFEHREVKASPGFDLSLLRGWSEASIREDVENNALRITRSRTDLAAPGSILYFKGFASRVDETTIVNPSISLYQKNFDSLAFLPEAPYKINGNVEPFAYSDIPNRR